MMLNIESLIASESTVTNVNLIFLVYSGIPDGWILAELMFGTSVCHYSYPKLNLCKVVKTKHFKFQDSSMKCGHDWLI